MICVDYLHTKKKKKKRKKRKEKKYVMSIKHTSALTSGSNNIKELQGKEDGEQEYSLRR
jgi:hypothetical protein